MRTFPSLIAGEDADHEKWLHIIRASALLGDEISALKLKRALDRGAVTDDVRVLGRVGVSTPHHLAAAAAAARRAQPEWAATDLARRIDFARRIGRAIKRYAEEFVDMLTAEGHPKRLAVFEVASAIEMSAEENLARFSDQLAEVFHIGKREIRLVRKPDGVVGVCPPHNAAVGNSLIALGALVAGNAVIVKAPRSAPLATAWFWREIANPVLTEMDAPPGVMNLVCGDPAPVLEQWLNSDDVDDLMFFGESARGVAIGNEWTRRGKKAILELSGNDGVLVWRDAELDLAVTAVIECFYGSTQVCLVPKYVLVHADVAEEFIARLSARVEDIRPGYPEDDQALLSPVVKSAEFEIMLKDALGAGASMIRGGRRLELDGTPDDMGYFIEPTLLRVEGLSTAETLDVVREETFFPLLPIVVVQPHRRDGDGQDTLLNDCIDFMNRNRYGLRNSLWAGDPHTVETVCRRLTNGGLLKVNDSHIGQVAGLPTHGGTGLSGGVFGEANFPTVRTTHLQAISIATAVEPRRDIFSSVVGQR